MRSFASEFVIPTKGSVPATSSAGDIFHFSGKIYHDDGTNVLALQPELTFTGESYLSQSGNTITSNPVNLSGTHVTGTLAAGRFPALTGDVTTSAGSLSTAIANNAVTTVKILDANVTGAKIADTTITFGKFATSAWDDDTTLASDSSVKIPTIHAVKTYIDTYITGLKFKQDVVAATTANITLSGTQTIDGVSVIANDRVLVKNQSTASQNGIYIVAAGAWSRASDGDTGPELVSATVPVRQGTVNADTWWTITNDTITIGSTSITFSQTAGSGTYTAGSGITLTGNSFSIGNTAITNAMLAGSIDLTTKVTGILPAANGGTGNGFTAFTGPTSSTKTFTLPNASDTIACLGQVQTFTASPTFDATFYGSATNGKMVLGHTAALSVGGNNNRAQIFGTDVATSSFTLGAFSATAGNGAEIRFYRSKDASVGSATVVASGDSLGAITWYGAQQTGTFATQNPAAQIIAEVDTTVTSGASADMPGRLRFLVTPDGSGTLAEALKIDNTKLATFAGNLTVGTSNSITCGTIELGAASDTTISRLAAGKPGCEGVEIPTISSTSTLTNKRITKRTGTTASSATPTINTDNVDYYSLTAQAAAITSFTTNLSGTPTDAQTLWISITDNGTARAITWGSSFEASGTVALPTTTVVSTRLDVGFVWNTSTNKWRCVAVA